MRKRIPYLLLLTLLSTLGAQASATTLGEYLAQREFVYLKAHGHYQNFIQDHSYVEVVGTTFIGLQQASDERRTCLFGFDAVREADVVSTRFVCFWTGEYELRLLLEAGELVDPDPAAISIGIGNIRVTEPTHEIFGAEKAQGLLAGYPPKLPIKVGTPQLTAPFVSSQNGGGLRSPARLPSLGAGPLD